MHWLFSFKYWVISREVPKLFESKQISFNEGFNQFCAFSILLINFQHNFLYELMVTISLFIKTNNTHFEHLTVHLSSLDLCYQALHC